MTDAVIMDGTLLCLCVCVFVFILFSTSVHLLYAEVWIILVKHIIANLIMKVSTVREVNDVKAATHPVPSETSHDVQCCAEQSRTAT